MKWQYFTSLLLVASMAYAQDETPRSVFTPDNTELHPDVDTREVQRRGDLVQHVTNDTEDADPLVEAVVQVAQTPADDLDKWHISVIGPKDGSSPYTIELEKQWGTDPILRAYAQPEQPKDSWAHFTFYDANDKHEQWRWTPDARNPKGLKVVKFPTIILQPPRNKKYGDPKTVVFKYLWEGDNQDFSVRMNAAIKQYLRKLQSNTVRHKAEAAAPSIRTVKPIPKAKHSQVISKTPDEMAKQGFGQTVGGPGEQQIPPLIIPNDRPDRAPYRDDEDDEDEDEPSYRGLRGTLLPQQQTIVVIKDQDEMYGEDMQAEIEHDREELQQIASSNSPTRVRVKSCGVNEARRKYHVEPEDTPAVILIEGRGRNARVVEKRVCRPHHNEHFRGFIPGLFSALIWFGLSYAQASALNKVIHILMVIVIVLLFMVFFAMVLGMASFAMKRQQVIMASPVPAPSPPAPASPALPEK